MLSIRLEFLCFLCVVLFCFVFCFLFFFCLIVGEGGGMLFCFVFTCLVGCLSGLAHELLLNGNCQTNENCNYLHSIYNAKVKFRLIIKY